VSTQDFKLSFNNTTKAVHLCMALSTCLKHPAPPAFLFEKAEAKLEKEKKDGHIDGYYLYRKRLDELWNQLKSLPADVNPEQEMIDLNIGVGFKDIEGLTLEPSGEDLVAFNLSIIADPGEVAKWNWEMVKAYINFLVERQALPDNGNIAQVMGGIMRRKNGAAVQKLPIFRAPKVEDNAAAKEYVFSANKRRLELTLVIFHSEVVRSRQAVNGLYKSAQETYEKVRQTLGNDLIFLKEEFIESLKSMNSGSERFGVDLPMPLLIAVSIPGAGKKADVPSPSSSVKRPAAPVKRYPGYGLLKIDILDGGKRAVVKDFNTEYYEKLKIDRAWLEAEMKRLGINPDEHLELVGAAAAVMGEHGDINRMTIAEGEEPGEASEPYLHESYKDAAFLGGGVVSLRDRKAESIVKAEQLVAEVRFKKLGTPGRDIFGNPIEAPIDYSLFTVELGDNVTMGDNGKVFATDEGMVQITDSRVSVSKMFIYKGDVNLKSGNIAFHGSATIDGSIDHGASVVVGGDLIVNGAIGAAFVVVKGNLTVAGGVVTGEKGLLRVKGDVSAEFIGNSTVICSGNIRVKKSILNSSIVSGGSIDIDSTDGILAGGDIYCRDSITTSRLGFPNGDRTMLVIGGDWVIQNSLKIKSSRLKKIEQVAEEDRRTLRELVRKKDNQLTKVHRQQIENLKQRAIKARQIQEKLKVKIDDLQRNMNWKRDAKVLVRGLLCTNVDVIIAGKKITVTHEVVEVIISGEKKRGSYINPIEEAAS
jgi:uncharacterized protein (DUF342 family)